MKQTDYMNYGRPVQNFRAPGQYQQRMAPQFVPMQPTMQGGNFAPRPMNPQQQMQAGMFPNQPYQQNNDTMPGFEQLYGGESDWRNVKLGRIQDRVTDAQAEEQLEAYDDMLAKINGEIDTSVASSGNVGQVHSALMFIVNSLRDPESWVPTAHKGKLPGIKDSGGKVAKVLEAFAAEIKKLT